MRRDHRPFWLQKIQLQINCWYTNRFIRPQFDALGCSPMFIKPRSCEVHGREITAGNYLHLISHPTQPVRITTWSSRSRQGSIQIGDYCLIAPGVEITSEDAIVIGNNCMIATGVSIQDSDWHGLYNRTRPFRCHKAIHLADNVWIGMRSIICKGVRIGENSVVGAGSVVTKPVPDNVVVAGNPATIVKNLNPKRTMLKREFLFKNGHQYWENQSLITQYLSHQNTTSNWLRSLYFPNNED